MKVLFDEDPDYRLAQSFPTRFDVYSTQWMGWSGSPAAICCARPPQTASTFWLRQTGT